MIKNIYIYWSQGFENAPFVVKECLRSWIKHNSNWRIIKLDDMSLSMYMNIKEIVPNYDNKIIDKPALSDIIRITLLSKYGGLWVNATTFCMIPLDDWIQPYVDNGFFAFDKPCPDRLISSWFLYGEINSIIIQKMYAEVIRYWTNNNKMNTYFWFHSLFGDLYYINKEFRYNWDQVKKLPASGPHYLQRSKLIKELEQTTKEHINQRKSPLYKLTYKYDSSKYDVGCNLHYLLTNF